MSDDGKFMAFQIAKLHEAVGIGHGIFLFDFEKYEAYKKMGQWEIVEAKNESHARHESTFIGVDEKFYLLGGRRTSKATGQVFSLAVPEVDVFDFTAQTWSTLPPSSDLPTVRAGGAVFSHNDHIYVFGGESGSKSVAHA